MSSRTGHGIDLGFGMNAYVSLGMAGFFALLPLTAGVAPIAGLFGAFDPAGGSAMPSVVSAAFGFLSAFSIIIAPWLVPCLVLRARQPKGARIDWDLEEIVEWDGPWKRTTIRWENAEGARLSWIEKSSRYQRRCLAIQVIDKTNPAAVITAWNEAPEDALILRRRLEASKLQPLEDAVERHAGYTRQFEMERLRDPDRVAQTSLVRWVTRLGYIGGFIGPLVAGESPMIGLPISAVGALLLAWRATPVFRELVATLDHLRPAAKAMPAYASPYRAAATMDPVLRDPNEIVALRYRLRAVIAEAIVRGAFAIFPLAGAISSVLTDFK